MKVIDVSYAQGEYVDWKKVKNDGIKGAIIRVGYGRELKQKDSTFETNYKNANSAGIPILPYHYSYAINPENAKLEAETFLNWVEGKSFIKKVVFFDIEESKQYSLGQTKLRSIINTYADTVKRAGWECVVYSYLYFLNAIGKEWLNKNYRVWVAQYSSKCNYTGEKILWQYSSSGKVNGISTKVDMNECYDETLFMPDSVVKKKLTNPYPKKSTVLTVKLSEYGNCKLTNHFNLSEFQCHNKADEIKFDWYTVNALESARSFFNRPLKVSSAYRTESYNKSVGGAVGSYHTKGQAVDCYFVDGTSYTLLAKYLQAYGMLGIGCYYDDHFVHVDSRTNQSFWKNQTCTKVATHLPILKRGSTGQNVKDLQTVLKLYGYALNVDGSFGSGTEKAVKEIQKANKITVDGIVGINTWKKLFNL